MLEDVDENNKKQIINFLANKEQDILASESISEQLKLPEAYRSLKSNHFPLFVTV